MRLDLQRPDGSPAVLAFELADKSTYFSEAALREANVYFKRSYHRPDIEDRVPEELRFKVQPWGVNYACRSLRSAMAVLRAGITEAFLHGLDLESRRQVLANVVDYFRLNRPERFFYPASAPKRNQVAFQTRIWDESNLGSDDDRAVNELRAETVRLLRSEFGPRFVGGLIPNDAARSRYPELLAEQTGEQSAYIQLLRQSLVGVYTRGLHHSTAWKLPEYLSATMCVVTEPIRNRLMDPVVDGVHCLNYESAEECVEACVRIFEDRALQRHLRDNAEAYHRTSIDPARHMARCIEIAESAIAR